MKCVLPVLLLLSMSFAALTAPAPLVTMPRVKVGGREYVRLADWARGNGFKTVTISKLELKLINNSATLSFTVNSQKVTLKGVNVWISTPIVAFNGAPSIMPIDLVETIQPLLWPRRHHTGSRLKVICLDPGHGGKDTGNCEGSRLEKDYTLLLARELSAQLRQAGYKVTLTRSWDTFVELDDRPVTARRRQADLFVSLHFNAAAAPEAKGLEIYCLTPARTASTNARGEGAQTGSLPGNGQNDDNLLLAYQLQKAILAKSGLEDRGVRRARWAVLRPARMPAVLIEGGFMSNPADLKRITSTAWRRQLAQGVVEGIKNYQRLASPSK